MHIDIGYRLIGLQMKWVNIIRTHTGGVYSCLPDLARPNYPLLRSVPDSLPISPSCKPYDNHSSPYLPSAETSPTVFAPS